jgi:hypothetical protein
LKALDYQIYKMQWIKNLSICLVLISLVGSCLKQPEYSNVPEIDLKSLSVIKNSDGDSMIFVLHFQDGDGDLGVDGNETAIYTSATDSTDINTPFFYVYDTINIHLAGLTHESNLTLSDYGSDLSYVDYKAYRKIQNHKIDTLVLPPLSCKYWTYPDSLYFRDNPYYYNFFVDIYVKNPTTKIYEYIDPYLINNYGRQCIHNLLNGRFKVLSSDLGKKSPLDGTVTYGVSDGGYLQGKSVKFKIRIMDRAFHKSNIDSVFHNF